MFEPSGDDNSSGRLNATLPSMNRLAFLFALCLSAAASTVTFSVSAVDGPFPAVVNSQVSFTDQEYTTIVVAPDPALEASISPYVDAVIDYTVAYTPVAISSCETVPGVICGGTEDYQITGPYLDSGASGGYGGLNFDAPWSFDPVGKSSGTLYLAAGTYTFSAYAETMVEGIDAVVNPTPAAADSYASIVGDFTVVAGDPEVVQGTPEPSPSVLLLAGAALLIVGRWSRR
jgi:hypothetical protein